MKDAFGRALWEYYKGEGEGEYITEREDGKRETAEISHYFDPYGEWEELTKKAMEYVRDEDTVLDVGCGAGRHSLWLQSRGQDVVAIDRSPLAIRTCKERGVENCEAMSMTDLNFSDNIFDTILVVGNIIGLGGDVESVRCFLDELDRITTDQGRVIADTQDPFVTDSIDDEYFSRNCCSNQDAISVRFRIRYRNMVEDWIEILLLGKEGLKEAVSESPWNIHKLINADPDKGWYSVKAQWYFVVLDKI